ncbi:multidrug transporter [Photobacterium japonica]|uniref:multidrug transporter n=1 Tax=Photobacterium japonica TaxID=2910235 RepID=UPI003D127FB5
MTLLAIVLVLLSAVIHASWNLLGKRNTGSGVAFSLAASGSAALLLSPFLLWYLFTIGWDTLSPAFWQLLLISGLCQLIYLVGLLVAYQHGDIGLIYPIARALPVLMVGGITRWLGLSLDNLQWLGFVLITIGCLIVPLSSFRQLSRAAYCNLGVGWALIAALGTTGYSVVDKAAMALLTELVHTLISDPLSALFYLGMQFWAMVLPLLLGIAVYAGIQRTRGHHTAILAQTWQLRRNATLAGSMMAMTYGLVLFAMTMTDNVSLIVALRQFSIVVGLIMGTLFLKEKWYITRGVGVAAILGGILLTL